MKAETSYRISASHVAERIKIKELQERTQYPIEFFSSSELVIRYDESSYAFLYSYGSIVFFNVPDELQGTEIGYFQKSLQTTKEVYKGVLKRFKSEDTSDDYFIRVNPDLTPKKNLVFSDRMEVGKLSFPKVRMICRLIAESTALDFYDIQMDELLQVVTGFTRRLENEGQFLESNENLLKFVGKCLTTKQEIISNLYIVDSPEETWESVELDTVFHDLKRMFEIVSRYRAVEYKSQIIQESIEVITDLVKSKREVMLEVVIIILIAAEILLSFVR